MSTQLAIQGATKHFGGITANDDISLEVPEGRVIGLIGPNGSGKSTLFNSIVGYHPVDGGSIRFEGREITRLRTAEIARLGLIRTFQQTHVFVRMTGLQNMAISDAEAGHGLFRLMRPVSVETRERAEALLAFCGLYGKRHLMAGELSFGQRKLLELAMALMVRPRMLLLDEPTAGINPTLINGVIERLRRANREFGVTLFVIEHNMRVDHEPGRAHPLPGPRPAARQRPARGAAQRPARDRRLPGGALMAATQPGTSNDVPMDFETALSVDAVEEAARELAGEGPARQDLEALCQGEPAIDIQGLARGLRPHGDPPRHRPSWQERASRSASSAPTAPASPLCSTPSSASADVMAGSIQVGSKDVTRLASSRRLSDAGVAYVLQDNSVFPDMTVEENLLMGGFLLQTASERRKAGGRARVRTVREARQPAGTGGPASSPAASAGCWKSPAR